MSRATRRASISATPGRLSTVDHHEPNQNADAPAYLQTLEQLFHVEPDAVRFDTQPPSDFLVLASPAGQPGDLGLSRR